MFDHLKQLSKHANTFLDNRWTSPLHTDAATEKHSSLWPSSDDFFHPLNPMFSVFFADTRQVNAYDVVLLRDGAHTLLDFYIRFPTPKKSRTLFLVNAELYFLVPDAWRSQTLAYRVDYAHQKPSNKLVFYGLISETFMSWNRSKYHLPNWLKKFSPDSDVSAYFVVRNEAINHQWDDKTISFEVATTLQHHFNKKIEFLNYESLKKQGSNGEATFVSLDLWRTGVGLCAIENLFMGQAIKVHPRGKYEAFSGEKIGEWPMSFGHKMSIYRGDCPDSDYGTFFMMRKMNAYPLTPKLLDILAERLKVI